MRPEDVSTQKCWIPKSSKQSKIPKISALFKCKVLTEVMLGVMTVSLLFSPQRRYLLCSEWWNDFQYQQVIWTHYSSAPGSVQINSPSPSLLIATRFAILKYSKAVAKLCISFLRKYLVILNTNRVL